MTREERLRMVALGNVIQRKIDKLKPGSQLVEFPAPHVVNEVNPTPIQNHNHVDAPVNNVTINTERLATVINCMTDNVEGLTARMEQREQQFVEALGIIGKTMAAIVQLLTQRQPDVHHHEVTLTPDVRVVAEPLAFPPERPKRSIKVTHSDGSESIIEEI